MSETENRWEKRFENYQKALAVLTDAFELAQEKKLSDLEEEGLIQRFEYTHELAWKVMKDYLINQGSTTIMGSKNATRESFQIGLITEGGIWMDMIEMRNITSHTYLKELAQMVVEKVKTIYLSKFKEFEQKMMSLLELEGE